MNALLRLAVAGLLVSVPLLLITTNVRLAFESEPLYLYALDAYDAPLRTGLPRSELVKGARALLDYFPSGQELISVTVRDGGVDVPLFNEREVLHLKDVKGLVEGVKRVQAASLLYLLLATGLVVFVGAVRGGAWFVLLRGLRVASLVTAAGIGAVALVSLLGGFNFLFLQFHLIGFRNDYWMTQGRLVQMFPQGFWFVSAMLVGGATVLEAGAIALVSTVVMRRSRPRERRGPRARSPGAGRVQSR